MIEEENMKKTKLEKQLRTLINSESRECDSDTPDHILAEYMMNCLDAFELAINKRDSHHHVDHSQA